MAAVVQGDAIADSPAPEAFGGSEAAFAAAFAARLAVDGPLPAVDAAPFDPAPWEIDESAAPGPAAGDLPDIVFLAGDDVAAPPADGMPADAVGAAALVAPFDAAPPADATEHMPAPWEIADPYMAAVAPVGDDAADILHLAMAAEDGPDPVDGFDAAPPDAAASAVDVAALLDGFGHVGPDGGATLPEGPGAAAFGPLAGWPAGPPDGADTEPWPG